MKRALIGAMLVLATAAPAMADFEDGVAAYNRGDYGDALREFVPLAEAGEAAAQLILGAMYAAGEGLRQDYAEAVKWYRRAAEQGSPAAQNSLGVMYEHGAGVTADPVEAYAWYSLAAAHDDPNPVRYPATNARDRIARGLTPEEIAEAQALARDIDRRIAAGAGRRNETAVPATAPARADDAEPGLVTPVAPIQKRLAMLGYDPGPADGVLGPRTHAAIRAFQRDNDLVATGAISAALLDALRSARPQGGKLERHSAASGFVVNRDGYVLTANHVVKDCLEIRIEPHGVVKRTASDAQLDLALLKGDWTAQAVAAFRAAPEIRQGDSVIAAGFPLQGLLTTDVTVTAGIVSALSGPENDRRVLQITAPIQQGSSGGPLLDLAGNAVGVVVAKLDALKVAARTGDLPQNVNFAVAARVAGIFLKAHGVAIETQPSQDRLTLPEVAARARKVTVLVECWK